jgi:hypothetical protein
LWPFKTWLAPVERIHNGKFLSRSRNQLHQSHGPFAADSLRIIITFNFDNSAQQRWFKSEALGIVANNFIQIGLFAEIQMKLAGSRSIGKMHDPIFIDIPINVGGGCQRAGNCQECSRHSYQGKRR